MGASGLRFPGRPASESGLDEEDQPSVLGELLSPVLDMRTRGFVAFGLHDSHQLLPL